MARNALNWLINYKIEFWVITIGLLHQMTQKVLHLSIAWFDNYGDDLLAVPFVAGIVLIAENLLVYKHHQRKHHFLQLVFIFIAISIVFEFVAPQYSSHYFYDPIDIVYYFIGFITYYFIKKSR